MNTIAFAHNKLSQADLFKLYNRLSHFYTSHNFSEMDVAILQDLDPFLEAGGEELRRQLFTTTGAFGEPLCLRPEFTIPVCQYYLTQHSNPSLNSLPFWQTCYFGPVFRQDQSGPYTTLQSGVEYLGTHTSSIEEDAEIMALALEAINAITDNQSLTVKLGDPSLFHGLLDNLELDQTIKNRLMRAFRHGLSDQNMNLLLNYQDSDLNLPFTGMDIDTLEMTIKDMMQAHGLSLSHSRRPQDIAQRYAITYQGNHLSQADQADLIRILNAYLQLAGPAHAMPEQLRIFEQHFNVSLGAALDDFQARLSYFTNRTPIAIRADQMIFSAHFARPLDYYTGFVFEIFSDNPPYPIAGGGRYDHLMEILGASQSIPAVGFALWLDRLTIQKQGY